MENFWQEWGIPYLVSNIAACFLLYVAVRRPGVAKYLYSAVFISAAFANTRMALINPSDYLFYEKYAWPIYQDFIQGPFSDYVQPMVLLIALGQLSVGIGFLMRGKLFQLACVGSIIFLLAITPLGLGSAFPFTLIASFGSFLILRAHAKQKIEQRDTVGSRRVQVV